MDRVSIRRIGAELKNLSLIRQFVADRAATLGAAPQVVSDLVMAVNEASANIIVHGYRQRPGIVEVEVTRRDDYLEVRLRDHAPPFDPTTVPTPDMTLALEQRPYGGMGVHLMRQLVDNLSYRITPQGGNELTLVKRLSDMPQDR